MGVAVTELEARIERGLRTTIVTMTSLLVTGFLATTAAVVLTAALR